MWSRRARAGWQGSIAFALLLGCDSSAPVPPTPPPVQAPPSKASPDRRDPSIAGVESQALPPSIGPLEVRFVRPDGTEFSIKSFKLDYSEGPAHKLAPRTDEGSIRIEDAPGGRYVISPVLDGLDDVQVKIHIEHSGPRATNIAFANASVRGRVAMDEKPFAGAPIRLAANRLPIEEGVSSEYAGTTVTDENGLFVFDSPVIPGSYFIACGDFDPSEGFWSAGPVTGWQDVYVKSVAPSAVGAFELANGADIELEEPFELVRADSRLHLSVPGSRRLAVHIRSLSPILEAPPEPQIPRYRPQPFVRVRLDEVERAVVVPLPPGPYLLEIPFQAGDEAYSLKRFVSLKAGDQKETIVLPSTLMPGRVTVSAAKAVERIRAKLKEHEGLVVHLRAYVSGGPSQWPVLDDRQLAREAGFIHDFAVIDASRGDSVPTALDIRGLLPGSYFVLPLVDVRWNETGNEDEATRRRRSAEAAGVQKAVRDDLSGPLEVLVEQGKVSEVDLE